MSTLPTISSSLSHDSSVGMALAAMEALDNLNLFGEEVRSMGM